MAILQHNARLHERLAALQGPLSIPSILGYSRSPRPKIDRSVFQVDIHVDIHGGYHMSFPPYTICGSHTPISAELHKVFREL